MIKIKNGDEIDAMRRAGWLAGRVLQHIEPFIKVGVSTQEINDIAHDFTLKNGGLSAPLNYKGFPRSICSSINNVVCHGIPSLEGVLQNGDIVNFDVTVKLDGFHGDTSRTFFVGDVDSKIKEFVKIVEKAMYLGISAVRPNAHFGEIGAKISRFIKPYGYGIVKELGGHGIGRNFHEEPFVMHHKQRDRGPKMKPGMIFTVEPMINIGSGAVFIDEEDGWTVYTQDGSLSAQFEHTVLVTDSGHEVLTMIRDGGEQL